MTKEIRLERCYEVIHKLNGKRICSQMFHYLPNAEEYLSRHYEMELRYKRIFKNRTVSFDGTTLTTIKDNGVTNSIEVVPTIYDANDKERFTDKLVN